MTTGMQFATTPRIGIGAVSTANTNFDGTGTIVDLLTAGSSGTKINRIIIQATVDPADSMIPIFLYNGSTYYLYDIFDIGNPATSSATVAGYRDERSYSDLVLPTSSWKISASITVALTSGVMNVFALGADL